MPLLIDITAPGANAYAMAVRVATGGRVAIDLLLFRDTDRIAVQTIAAVAPQDVALTMFEYRHRVEKLGLIPLDSALPEPRDSHPVEVRHAAARAA